MVIFGIVCIILNVKDVLVLDLVVVEVVGLCGMLMVRKWIVMNNMELMCVSSIMYFYKRIIRKYYR